jgi:cation diffusion facilitator family transporter
VATLSVVSNSVLVVGKLAVGLAIGSVSVISEAIHSGVDLLAAVIALFSVRSSGKPADEQHTYGHGKIENVSGTIEALLIFVAALWIIFEAVRKLLHNEPLDAPAAGIIIMLVSALANLVVSSQLFRVGRKTDSVALIADAWHLRTDVWTSFGVMAGLTVILLGRWLFPGVDLVWVDPVVAIVVALMIMRAAWRLLVSSGRDLLDVSLPEDEEKWLLACLDGLGPPVLGYHKVRTRKAGADRFIDVHLEVTAGLAVKEAHQVSDSLSAAIRERFPGVTVTVHVDPVDGDASPADSTTTSGGGG